ncbi:MAG TPA: bifunctional [glutamate--ammonia ligase]-adenylyl-L-tyrosine phosphorylase/[glutamate--ammonia-ligase] adenylyltransferase [Casimicrobiaceae bacterium]|nr:bifunctional [glutamate--ammonia ligase]-adenylyl-L-tyrosine phosphorylase/[glutamate--ammonia-ligase] adenylyltransferase [Casimicrobiaceae bacterium]
MDLDRALAFSRYAQRVIGADPALCEWLAERIDAPIRWEEEIPALDSVASGDGTEQLASALRRLRTRVMLHTLARDLTGRADLIEVCAAVTKLAEIALDRAVHVHHQSLVAIHGEPIGEASQARQQLVVVAMGKLGGSELNVSSDVDLVFVYPEEGDTAGDKRISNREFFEKLGRRVIAALAEVTADGYVFRVDMRLRPYGDAGPLAVPLRALEHYLVTQGRTWERYAWLKARPLTGAAHAELDALITPFVYRKYLDYDAYEGLRDVHRQIRAQGALRDHRNDIKLGEGGIREIEFVVQAMQIVRGGREPALRVRGTLPALDVLRSRGLLPAAAIATIVESYRFLRNLEHRLQYRDDQQTQQLPTDANERAVLATACGEADVASFDRTLAKHRAEVSTQFDSVFGQRDAAHDDNPFVTLWEAPASADVRDKLRAAGYRDSDALVARLARLRASSRYLQLPALSRERVDDLVPQLLAAAAGAAGDAYDPQDVFLRLLDLLETVSRRSAYLALLIEHPPLVPRLASLMGASAWAADYLTRHPLLLDELLDARILFAESDWDTWRREIRRALDASDDVERRMEALRHFQRAQTFRLLVQDLAGALSVERLADHLSALADIVIEATLAEAWRQMQGANALPPRFAVIAYGKLGGKELGYASDLDLVFLYEVDDASDVDSPERYAKLARRINSWLTSTTAEGPLYDTDLRLRPDGAAGLIVSSVPAFRRYQEENAWTWEHQALTRARFVAGDEAIGAAFESEREAILCMPRPAPKLAHDVVDMRRRMHAGHPNPTPLFDIKHDMGGMVDIEFAVQFLVLAYAHSHHELTRNAGNIALLHMAGELSLIPVALAKEVADAYRDYRREQHAVRLTGAAQARVDPQAHIERRKSVDALWQLLFGHPWTVAKPQPSIR